MRSIRDVTAASAALAGLWAAPGTAIAEQPVVLQPVTVEDQRLTGAAVEQQILDQVPGGTNLIQAEELKQKSGRTLGNALEYQPGVVVQEFFGGIDQPRVNIRGSGIQSNPLSRGLLLLENGLPINQSDGSFIIGQLEPRAANFISIYRGANALSYGGATLGGAINFQQFTGHDLQGIAGGVEGGSWGYAGGQFSAGGVYGNWDGYASYTHNRSDGFQGNHSNRGDVILNGGYRLDAGQVRLTYSHLDLDFDIPVALSKRQIEDDPSQTFERFPFFVSTTKPRRQAVIDRVALFGDTALGNGTLKLGTYFQNVDDSFKTFFRYRFTDGYTIGGRAAYELPMTLFGRPNHLAFGVRGDWGEQDQDFNLNTRWPGFGPLPSFRTPGFGDVGPLYGSADLEAWNITAFVEDTLSITDRLDLLLGGQYTYAARDASHNVTSASLDQDYDEFIPRIGVNYRVHPDVSVFANVSRSFEAPTFDEIVGDTPNPPARRGISFKELDAQTATTVEVGTRGRWQGIYWETVAYHSWVRDELLDTTDAFGVSTTRNYDKTTHRGLEIGLGAELWRGQRGTVSTRGVYNLSDFEFDGGLYDGNQIGGIPRHVIQAELRYTDVSGFYIAPNVYWSPEKTPADHQNTIHQDAYALFGLNAGYESEYGWSVFIEGKNLLDKKYAASYLITDTPAFPYAKEDQPVFIAGAGASVNAGLKFRW